MPFPTRPSIHRYKAVTDEDLALPVERIAIVGALTSDGQLYHFRLFLVNVSKQSSVSLDAHPAALDFNDFNRGVVVVERHEPMYPVSSSSDSIAPFELDTQSSVSVERICDILFNENSLDKYRFTEEGTGCRHWCATVLQTLGKAKLVSETAREDFEKWEEIQGERLGTKFPMPRMRGEFYH